MSIVTIFPETGEHSSIRFRAVGGDQDAVGATAGEALDALQSKMGGDSASSLLVLEGMKPDRFFNEQQQQRLEQLMGQWRAARDQGGSLPPAEQAELQTLVELELKASGDRAEAIARALGR